jgi:hypothetical protein
MRFASLTASALSPSSTPEIQPPEGSYRYIEELPKFSFGYGMPYNPPCPPLRKRGNYKDLLLKSPFEKWGFRGI